MYHATTGLPHLVPPNAYCDPTVFETEVTNLLRPAWHLAATVDQLASDGQFVTMQLLGQEVYIRNFQGTLRAFANVCAHRHCLIESSLSGKSEAMRCQYHGWEYGEDGATRKIPCAKDFAPLDRSRLQLPTYRVDRCGQLVFVCLEREGPSLQDFLGEAFSIMEAQFGADCKQNYRRTVEYQANWKVAIENSLEAYHIESVHPETFRKAPAESLTDHHLGERYTSFSTDMPFAPSGRIGQVFQETEGWIVKRLGQIPKRRYSQHHVFPNLLFSCTDAISLVHSIRPIAVDRSESTMIQFGIFPRKLNFFQKFIAKSLGKLEAMILHRIMNEDIGMYPRIQRGLAVSPHVGMLARSEERIHSFQHYLKSYRG